MIGQLPSPQAPLEVARVYVAAELMHPDGLTLRHWRGGWWEWRTTRWVGARADARCRPRRYRFTEHAVYETRRATARAVGAEPAQDRRTSCDALAAITHLAEDDRPARLARRRPSTTGVIVSCANGLLDVAHSHAAAAHAAFWNATAVPFAYDPDGRSRSAGCGS